MPGADGNALAAGGAAAAEHGCAALGLHARPKPVCFRTVAAVGLKCAFGHGYPLLFLKENLCLISSFEYIVGRASNPASSTVYHDAGTQTRAMMHHRRKQKNKE